MSSSIDTLQFRFPTHGDSILCKMNALREERLFCDITLVLGGPRGTRVQHLHFHGHRAVLAASSDFLRDQFLLHEGQAELSVGVVSNVEVGKRLLLSCYTGLLEVPLRELVGYLTAASALQMSQAVDKCARAVSQYLSPTLAFLEVQGQPEQRDVEQQEGADAAEPCTSTKTGGVVVIQSKASQGAEAVNSEELAEIKDNRRVVESTVKLTEGATSCLNQPELEERGGHHPVHTNEPLYQLRHVKGDLRQSLDISSTKEGMKDSTRGGDLAESSEKQVEKEMKKEKKEGMLLLEESRKMTGSSIFHHLPRSRCSGEKLAGDPESLLVQKPYLCRKCDRVFQHLESYAGHLREHRQHLCLVCGKGFSQRTNLTCHIRVHTGVKPFRCPLCHKTFSQKATLQDHLNLHTGEKPHKCIRCAGLSAHKPGLRRHLKDSYGKSSLQDVVDTVD